MVRQINMELYVGHLKIRYIQSTRKEKKLILDEFCETSGTLRYLCDQSVSYWIDFLG